MKREASEEGGGGATLSKAFDLGERVPRAIRVLEPNMIARGWVEVIKDMKPLGEVGVEFLASDVLRGFIEHVLEVELEDGDTGLGRCGQGGEGVKSSHKGVCEKISATWDAEGKLVGNAVGGNGLSGSAHHHMAKEKAAEGGANTNGPEFIRIMEEVLV